MVAFVCLHESSESACIKCHKSTVLHNSTVMKPTWVGVSNQDDGVLVPGTASQE